MVVAVYGSVRGGLGELLQNFLHIGGVVGEPWRRTRPACLLCFAGSRRYTNIRDTTASTVAAKSSK
jgi:hypothetical protein